MGYDPTISRRIEADLRKRRTIHSNVEERVDKFAELRKSLEEHWAKAVTNYKRYYD